ncbi:alpha/beta fold hydrolase [Thalassobacillus hwangdonensis]|uniref:Alpha/beta fold hydrolase n=1 Tax=Thalassobacillus hwangdonensis TaxID=546108 RepID=A0ABW3L4Y8_9BACI
MEQVMDFTDFQLYVRTIGEGSPIVCLHGGPGGTHEFFLSFAQKIKDRHQVVLYDQMGCGRSSRSKEYTIEKEVEVLERLRKKLGLEQMTLMGESWGSMLALAYASAYPQYTKRIFLTAAIGVHHQSYHQFKKQLLHKLSNSQKFKLGLYSVLNGMGMDASHRIEKLLDPFYVYDKNVLERKTSIEYNPDVQRQLSKEIELKFDLIPALHSLSHTPILIAQGSHDVLSPDYIEDVFGEYLPHAEVVTVDKSGHWTILEQPDVMVDLLQDFIQSDKKKSDQQLFPGK